MFDDSVLADYRADLLEYLNSLASPINIGLSAALILLATPRSDSVVSAAAPIISIEDNALKLALAIDARNKLPDALKRITQELPLFLSDSVVTHNEWHISDLPQAIRLITKHPELNIESHVIAILEAIHTACQWTDEELRQQENQLAEIRLMNSAATSRYFHAEHHSGLEAKRSTLNRLNASIIGAWNHSILQVDGLKCFLSGIENSLCIEGATRPALEKMGLTLHQHNHASQTFIDAMARYHHQARAFLTALGFAPTIDNMKASILSAYSGEACLEYGDSPRIISDASVEKYLQDLWVYSSRENEEEVTSAFMFAGNYSIFTRVCLAQTIQPYTDQGHVDELMLMPAYYNKLLRLTRPGEVIVIAEYIKIITATNAINSTIDGQNLFVLTVINGYSDLAKRLLEIYPDSLLTQEKFAEPILHAFLSSEKNLHSLLVFLARVPGFIKYIPANFWLEQTGKDRAFYRLTSAESGRSVLKQWLDNNPNAFDSIPPGAWALSPTQGPYAGTCAIYWLASTKSGLPLLKQWLDNNPNAFDSIHPEAWAISPTQGPGAGACGFYRLTSAESGLPLLKQWLDNNPNAFDSIPPGAWAISPTQGPNAGTCAIYWLASTKSGLPLLKQWLDNNPNAFDSIHPEAWAISPKQGVHTGFCALHYLALTPVGQTLLAQLLTHNSKIFSEQPLDFFLNSLDSRGTKKTFIEWLHDSAVFSNEEILLPIYIGNTLSAIQSYQEQSLNTKNFVSMFNDHSVGLSELRSLEERIRNGITLSELKTEIQRLSEMGQLRKKHFAPLLPLFGSNENHSASITFGHK